jgi:hypothetical protein
MIDTTATINGLTIGAGTSYRWASWPAGLFDTPAIRSADAPRAQQHGVLPGLDWMGALDLAFDVVVMGTSRSDGETKLLALLAAFAPSASEATLDVRVTGSPAEYRLYGRTRGAVSAAGRQFINGKALVHCAFRATDPRRYSTTQQTASTGLASAGGGFIVPAVVPWSGGSGGTGSTMSCPNNGTFAAPWVATFTGPLVSPTLTHVATGKQLIFSTGSIASGETLVVDSKNKTVMLNGTASRYSWLSGASRWFDLDPGANSVNLTGASGAGTVQLAWRSAWV